MTAAPLIVRTTVAIDASAATVWKILTTVSSMAEWDDLPDEYEGDSLTLGSRLLWRRVDGGYTRLSP